MLLNPDDKTVLQVSQNSALVTNTFVNCQCVRLSFPCH